MTTAKSFAIPKQMVWGAYTDVKKNDGSPGVDGVSIKEFEQDLKNNLYKIWNRMASGTYFPPAVLRVEIPKANGGKRYLGIPTISDRIAQAVAKRYLEPIVEPCFHPDSYGYRPGRSALNAIAQTRKRCWRDDWVLDLDIKGFFDNLDHSLVLRAVRRFSDCHWLLLYVDRWLKADVQLENGMREKREIGTPQGGVISPLLANLFLHLAFDQWMLDNFPHIHFERYADDVVVHCRSRQQVGFIKQKIENRLKLCKLELNAEKTSIVYCKDTNRSREHEVTRFDFLGFSFHPRSVRDKKGQFFISFSPAISRSAAKKIRQTVRRKWCLKQKTFLSLDILAKWLNPFIRGWINYYGSFRRSALSPIFDHINTALIAWVNRKFKKFRGHKTRAAKWLKGVAQREPNLFAHWQYGFTKAR